MACHFLHIVWMWIPFWYVSLDFQEFYEKFITFIIRNSTTQWLVPCRDMEGLFVSMILQAMVAGTFTLMIGPDRHGSCKWENRQRSTYSHLRAKLPIRLYTWEDAYSILFKFRLFFIWRCSHLVVPTLCVLSHLPKSSVRYDRIGSIARRCLSCAITFSWFCFRVLT